MAGQYSLERPMGSISLTDFITNSEFKNFLETGNPGQFDFQEAGQRGIFEFPDLFTPEQCETLMKGLREARDPSMKPREDVRSDYGWPVTNVLEVLFP